MRQLKSEAFLSEKSAEFQDLIEERLLTRIRTTFVMV
jgi:hypothetical protein